jgi:serine/threonine protein kinase
LKTLLGGDEKFRLIDQLLTTNLDEYIKMMSVPYSELVFEKMISENAFVKIHQGKWRGQPVAIKEVKDPSDPQKIEKLVEQARILKKLKHPNLTEFKCFVAEDPHYCLVLELSEGSISNFIHMENKVLTIEQMINYSFQIAKGLKYLHSQGLIYGVLTTRRIQLNIDHIVLSDFFLMYQSYIKDDVLITPEIVEKVIGCPYFVPPEILSGEKSSEKSDVFSLATCMYEIFSREKLSRGKYETENVIKQMIEKNTRACSKSHLESLIFDNEENKKIVEYLKIIQQSWNKQPEDRPSMDDIIEILKDLSEEQLHLMSRIDINKENDNNSNFSEKYEIGKQIGIGGQARVFLVKRKSDQKKFALKKFNETPFSQINKDLQEVIEIIFTFRCDLTLG